MSNESTKYLATWDESLIRETHSLKDALEAIAKSGALMACIVGADQTLKAILTDSDIRRALLSGANLTDKVMQWANKHPTTASEQTTTEGLYELAQQRGIREIPLVDANGRVVDIYIVMIHERKSPSTTNSLSGSRPREVLPNHMLILAGGLGTRLRPIVSDRPKSLALVGNRPIIETLISQAVSTGIESFYVAVNYMSEQIEAHLATPQYAGLNIKIIRENKKLGTAGAIGLIKREIQVPLLVCNADLLTTVPFHQVVRHHLKEESDITCTVRPYCVSIPFGVVDIRDKVVVGIIEKPQTTHFVNTGIYALSPEICMTVAQDEYLDMPNLIAQAVGAGKKVTPFLLHEYWMDVGHPDDFHKANAEYSQHFGSK